MFPEIQDNLDLFLMASLKANYSGRYGHLKSLVHWDKAERRIQIHKVPSGFYYLCSSLQFEFGGANFQLFVVAFGFSTLVRMLVGRLLSSSKLK